MREQSAFMKLIARRFAGARQRRTFPLPECVLFPRESAVRALPSLSKPAAAAWPHEDCANEPSPFHCFVERQPLLAAQAVKALLFFLGLFLLLPVSAAVREVGAIGLTVGDLGQALEFYTRVLPFEKISESTAAPGAADALLGLSNTRLRSAELKLGEERIILTEHLTNKGRPLAQDSRSYDHWFQHIAIVVSDMDKAYDHLRRHKVRHVSTAPQTLPEWNPSAGGIKAFYFRDPEAHVLEIIWFPAGKGDPKWQQPTTNLFLGIDHTAIVVSDTDRSLHFYTNALGFRVAGASENHGVEQEHLNQVFGARLRITALRAEAGPGIEFLEYIAPPDGRPLPSDARANDLVFWTTELRVQNGAALAQTLRDVGARFVSRQQAGNEAAFIVRDPDGHALRVQQAEPLRRTATR
jgi:catechol 2,3-dioxygenase-like lactoylglutathione lyase family enzyme